MQRLLILGGGTAGTMVANRLRRRLPDDWQISVVDRDDVHVYQPALLFIPFGTYPIKRITKSRKAQLAKGVEFVRGEITRLEPEANQVTLSDGRVLGYDWLVIASGSVPRPDQTPGMGDGALWRSKVFDFYTLDGAVALRKALAQFEGGRLLVHITEMPIKCPIAPLEFVFLAEDHFRKRGIRHKVDITFVTPLDGAFTKPVASRELGDLLEERSIRLATDFNVEQIDNAAAQLVSYDGRALPFDLLVTIPLHMGAQYLIDSGLGDATGFVPVDKQTLRSEAHDNIFVLGDASNIPTSKAGSVAHFAVEEFEVNFLAAIEGRELLKKFDGHANCFLESGRGQALLLDFNYETQPLPGSYPLPVAGPMRLLKATRINHWGKLAFEWLYWKILMRGGNLPVTTHMSMVGKKQED